MIPFTQFLRPDGRRKETGLEATPEVEAKARKLIEAGCVFEIEVLNNDMVSAEVVRERKNPGLADEDPEVVAWAMCPNTAEVPPAIAKMVEEAFNALHLQLTENKT